MYLLSLRVLGAEWHVYDLEPGALAVSDDRSLGRVQFCCTKCLETQKPQNVVAGRYSELLSKHSMHNCLFGVRITTSLIAKSCIRREVFIGSNVDCRVASDSMICCGG
jgi:hypothetical protein